jgi:hypothetical protein
MATLLRIRTRTGTPTATTRIANLCQPPKIDDGQ